jgi:hypothetical protein
VLGFAIVAGVLGAFLGLVGAMLAIIMGSVRA